MAEELIYVDYEDGIKRVMNNEKLYVKLLAKFRADTNFDELEAALAAGDMEKAQPLAHTIKGVAANLSLAELYKQILELETQIKARQVNPGQITAAKDAFVITIQKIDQVIAQNG